MNNSICKIWAWASESRAFYLVSPQRGEFSLVEISCYGVTIYMEFNNPKNIGQCMYTSISFSEFLCKANFRVEFYFIGDDEN
jgi:hypothetical protein